jgi:hypothetical protein
MVLTDATCAVLLHAHWVMLHGMVLLTDACQMHTDVM